MSMLYEAIACVPRTQGSEFVLAKQKSVSYKKERQLNQRPDMLTEVRTKCQTNKNKSRLCRTEREPETFLLSTF